MVTGVSGGGGIPEPSSSAGGNQFNLLVYYLDRFIHDPSTLNFEFVTQQLGKASENPNISYQDRHILDELSAQVKQYLDNYQQIEKIRGELNHSNISAGERAKLEHELHSLEKIHKSLGSTMQSEGQTLLDQML